MERVCWAVTKVLTSAHLYLYADARNCGHASARHRARDVCAAMSLSQGQAAMSRAKPLVL